MPSAEHYLDILAPVKINLNLHVGGVLDNGFHPLTSLAVFADFGDRIQIGLSNSYSLQIKGPFAGQLAGIAVEKNLVTKAINELASWRGEFPEFDIIIEKNVPAASGMGGGTCDAAAALMGAARLWGLKPSAEKLLSLMNTIGSDGPVCLAPHLKNDCAWLMTKTGSTVEPGPILPEFYLCLANPVIELSTADVFAKFDEDYAPPPAMPALPARYTLQGLIEFMENTTNSLQKSAIGLAPEIEQLEAMMRQQAGCLSARMTGSGATIFGIFAERHAAKAAASYLTDKGYWAVAAESLHDVAMRTPTS